MFVCVAGLWTGRSRAASARDVCRREPVDTIASKTPGDNGFRIKIAGRAPIDRYSPGQVYTGR